jgi:uncharacterized protein
MRFALVIGACFVPLFAAAPAGADDVKTSADSASAQSIRQTYRAQLNDNTVTIMAGTTHGSDAAVVQDIAAVLDDREALRVVPMIGKGPAQTVKDVLFMRGVDMGITHATVLGHFAKTGELGPIKDQIAYVAKLFNEEMHLLARAEIEDVKALDGKVVNFGPEGSGTEVTARLVFETLGVHVSEAHLDDADAIAKLSSGEIDATVVIGGKPAPLLSQVERNSGFKFLALPYAKGLEEATYPATLTHEDYPDLIEPGARIDTVAVCAVLISFNWDEDSARTKKLERFVDRFFTNFDAFLDVPRHPKWQEVNFAATLEDWKRSPLAQHWIDNAKTAVAADAGAREKFETFLAQADTGASAVSEEERTKLFRAFLEWSKTQKN